MITIECAHCHKRYNAPSTLAGKKVKCKHCGKVFAIPAEVPDAPVIENGLQSINAAEPAESPPAAPPRAAESPRPRAGAVQSRPDEPAKLGDPSKGCATRLVRKEGVQDLDVAGDAGSLVSIRPSVGFDFPGAQLIDSFAPTVLALVGLGLLAVTAATSNLTGVSWVAPARIAIYVGLYFVVVFPLCWVGLKWAAGKLRFAMPPAAPGRAIGAFALSFAVAMSMWLTGETTGMLIFGTILGAVLACGAVWLLFRLQPQEIATACAASAGAFFVAVLASYGILVLANMGFQSAATRSGASELASSPVGPLAWSAPAKRPELALRARATQPEENPQTQPETQPSTQDVGTVPLTRAIIRTRPQTLVAIDTRPATRIAIDTQPSPDPATRGVEVVHNPPDTQKTTQPTIAATRRIGVDPLATASPLIARAQSLSGPQGFDSLLLVPGNPQLIATVHASGKEDTVELWTVNPPARRGSASFAREKNIPPSYAISGNGDWVVRFIAWPRLAVSVWSMSEQKVVKTVPVESIEGAVPRIVSFGLGDALLVNWSKGSILGYQSINIRGTGQQLAAFEVDPIEPTVSNPALSPDGRILAVAAEVKDAAEKGGIDLYDVTASRKKPLRTCPVVLAQWVKPAGLAFSADSKLIAAFFQQESRGLLVCYRVQDGKSAHEHILQSLPVPQEIADSYPIAAGRALDWLDLQTWLLYGQALVDVETGKPLGTLDVPNVRSQRVIDRDTILLTTGDGAERGLVLVKLKPEAIAAARARLRNKGP